MIVVLDCGSGNLKSAERGLAKAAAAVRPDDPPQVVVSEDPQALAAAAKLVLPGQGAFADCMAGLARRGLVEPLRRAVARGVPTLGICVGMQLFFERSSEDGVHEGLGFLPGEVVRFGPEADGGKRTRKIPHMGWNAGRLTERGRGCPLLDGVADGTWFYFVHSYYATAGDPSVVAMEAEYGVRFAAAVWKGSLFATQFHPEKSQAAGLALLENFVRLEPAKGGSCESGVRS